MSLSLPFPESSISSPYGPRRWNSSNTFHTGCDFAVRGGVNVPAADAGIVTKVEYTNLRGYQVQIQHGRAARTRYHMLDESIPVREGQSVSKGQTIGTIASKAYSPTAAWIGPHLHFETWYPFTDGSNPSYTHMDPPSFIRSQSNTDPAGGSGTPLTPINPSPEAPPIPLENEDMIPVKLDGKHLYTIGRGQISHQNDASVADFIKNVVAADDKWIEVNKAGMVAILDAYGVPRNALDGNTGLVLNPENGKYESGGMWSWERHLSVQLYANPKATWDHTLENPANGNKLTKAGDILRYNEQSDIQRRDEINNTLRNEVIPAIKS